MRATSTGHSPAPPKIPLGTTAAGGTHIGALQAKFRAPGEAGRQVTDVPGRAEEGEH